MKKILLFFVMMSVSAAFCMEDHRFGCDPDDSGYEAEYESASEMEEARAKGAGNSGDHTPEGKCEDLDIEFETDGEVAFYGVKKSKNNRWPCVLL